MKSEFTDLYPGACLSPQSGNPVFYDGFSWEGSTYYVSRDPKTWTEARDACQKACGNLAFLETKEELEAVLGQVKTKVGTWLKVWVGATRVGKTKDFLWMSGVRLLEDNEAWNSGFPKSGRGRQNCVLKSSSMSTNNAFTHAPCNNKYRFLCEIYGL
jgi:hypothetical protein